MIFGNSSIATYQKNNIIVWFLMAFQAGTLNVGGFMASHRFVSHVTGFATFFAVDTLDQNYWHALGMLVVPFFFLLGAMLSAQLVDVRLKLKLPPKYYFSFGIIFLLIATVFLAGHFNWFSPFGQPIEVSKDYVLLILLCFACGIQNATITTVSRAMIRTSHLTGLTTDLGIGLVRVINRKKLAATLDAEEPKANLVRAGIIGFFILGSLVGGYCYKTWGYDGFLLPTVISGGLFTFMYLHASRTREK
jgi:uncharacterized membrane protein YoaK (UPF0700 family)